MNLYESSIFYHSLALVKLYTSPPVFNTRVQTCVEYISDEFRSCLVSNCPKTMGISYLIYWLVRHVLLTSRGSLFIWGFQQTLGIIRQRSWSYGWRWPLGYLSDLHFCASTTSTTTNMQLWGNHIFSTGDIQVFNYGSHNLSTRMAIWYAGWES